MFRPERCRGTAAAVAATGAAVEAATGAAVEAATGAAAKVTAAAVCCGSVRGATEVAVVNGAKAECSGRSGAGGTAAAVAATGAAVGSVGGWGGTNNDDLEGSSPVQREFLSENFVVGAFPQPLADSGDGVINPNPSAGRILGAAEEGIGEGGVAPIYPSDGEGVLFSYKFVRTLLALTSKVAVGELVAIEVLMYTTI